VSERKISARAAAAAHAVRPKRPSVAFGQRVPLASSIAGRRLSDLLDA